MTKLVKVDIGSIDANPFRMLGDYPYVENKLAALQRSFEDVGMWEGVIGRKTGNRTEIAFGHHRVEAARRMGLTQIPMIVRDDLDDEKMLKMMGRENGEDYNADFNCMFETWEAATAWLLENRPHSAEKVKPIEIARFLGWTKEADGPHGRMNNTAAACASTSKLLDQDMIERDDVKNMSVAAVREVVAPVAKQVENVEKTAKKFGISAAKTDKTKAALKKGLKAGVEAVKAGDMTVKEAAAQPHAAMMADRNVQREPAMFDIALQSVIKSVQGMLATDSVAEKIRQTVDALKNPDIAFNGSDRDTVDALRSALSDLSKRADRRERELDVKPVTTLRPVEPKQLPNG